MTEEKFLKVVVNKELKEDWAEIRSLASGKLAYTLKVRMLEGAKPENQEAFIERIKEMRKRIEKELNITPPVDIGR